MSDTERAGLEWAGPLFCVSEKFSYMVSRRSVLSANYSGRHPDNKKIKTEQTYTRRNWNEIVKLTAEWTDEKIMEVARLHIAALKKETVL